MDQEIAHHIEALKDGNSAVRQSAVWALIKIGSPAIPALCKALKHGDRDVRFRIAKAFVRMGDVSAVPALCKALKDHDWLIREKAAEALGQIRDASAVLALLEAMNDSQMWVRQSAASALWQIGNATTLPRKVLADARLTGQQRFQALETLRQLRYRDEKTRLNYAIPEIGPYCKQHLQDNEEAVRKGAQTVLDFLAGETLLRPTQRDEAKEREQLLRGAMPVTTEVPAEEHLRPSDAPASSSIEPEQNRGWWPRRKKG